MGYQVKWVEEHLGVTRKALRLYESKGLLPENKGGQYRNYSDKDIELIWGIKVLQGMGYTLKEIATIMKNDNGDEFDIQASISQKITFLEEQKAEIERHLGYAKMIQFTGRIPARPKEMGSVTFDAFHEQNLDKWNIHNDPKAESMQNLVEQILDQPTETWGESELGRMLQALMNLGMNPETMEGMIAVHALHKAIIARSSLGVNSIEVQTLVKVLFEQIIETSEISNLSPREFGRSYSSSIMEGQIGESNQLEFGVEGCAFIADAVAVFGGFKNYEDSQEERLWEK